MDPTAAGEFIKAFGFPTLVAIATLYLLVRRRKMNGYTKASFLVPGWVHDDLTEEIERVRSHYQAQLLEQRIECEKRINEYRELYEAEKALTAALQVRFEEVNAREEAQTKLIEELRVEIIESRRRAELK
jgi:hypothetical protein